MSAAYNPEAQYEVKLMRPVQFLGVTLRPISVHTMGGDILTALIDQEGEDCVDTAVER